MSTIRCHVVSLLLFVGAMISVASIEAICENNSVRLDKRKVAGAVMHVITADLNDPRIKIDIGLPAKGLSHSESFANMIRRRSPVAAVTGTYFDTRSLLPVGTVVIDGKIVHKNNIGTTVCFMDYNQVKFIPTSKGESCDLSGTVSGVRTGPRLLANGQYALSPAREGFRQSGLFGRRTRMAMGVTPYNKLLLVSVHTPVTFARLARIMRVLGAQDAVCLDGGSSSAMYYRGRVVRSPGRALTNIIEVHFQPIANPTINSIVRLRVPDASINGPPEWLLIWSRQETLVDGFESLQRLHPVSPDVSNAPDEAAVMGNSTTLSLAKGRRALFPINRAKLSGLKSLQDSNHFIHAAAYVKVMHHLVS